MTDAAAAPRKAKRQPLLSRVPAGFVRAVLKGHSSLGLAFAAAIYIVCLSGTIAVFAHEFQRWENPHAPIVREASPEVVQAAVAEAVKRTGPGLEHVFIYPAARDLPWLRITTDVEQKYRNFVADEQGRIVAEAASPWTEFLLALHINLHLPRTWGMFLVGLTGVALLSSLVSGLLAHPRIFRDAFHVRLGGSRRLQEADLHNRIGIWALPFHVVVSTTGALLGLTTLIVGVLGMALFQGEAGKVYDLFITLAPKDNPAPAPLLDLRPMYAQAMAKVPDGRVTFIGLEHPTEQGGAAMFNVETQSSRFSNTDAFTFDRNGKLYDEKRSSDSNLGERILNSIGPLHYGWFGGGMIKIAYGLLGLGMTYLAAGGVLIWLARRRDKGRAAPGWERVWSATIWGQPAALAIAALAGVVSPMLGVQGLLLAWAIGTAAFLTAAIARVDAALIARGGRILTAASLLLAVLAQCVIREGITGDGVGWAVNAGLVLVAALIVVPLARRPRTGASAAS
jgi:uncharacterized iron-regulated membrane protein